MKNPLVNNILTLLKDSPDGVSEFAILSALKEQLPEFSELADDANLQLFRQHFLIMNALYQLQTDLWREEKLVLSISALQIKLTSHRQVALSDATELINSGDAKLAAYYLDWSEYQKTDEDEVTRLLASFYNGLNLQDNKQQALAKLQIQQDNPTKADIKKQYRKLAQQHHPDVGGSAEAFIELRQAYEQLMV